MKKLLLILALPCFLTASDKSIEQKDERSTAQKIGLKATETARVGAAVYTGVELGVDVITSLTTGNYLGVGVALLKAAGKTASITSLSNSTKEFIDPEPTQTPLEIAHEESAKRAAIAEEQAGSRLRRCLSENARCKDINGRGFSKRCNSPARDFAMINAAKNDRVIDTFLKWQKERRGSV